MYEKANAELEKEKHDINQNWMEAKKQISVLKVELQKCRSSSSEASLGQFKSTKEKLTHERDHYSQQFERSKSLHDEMRKVEAELKSKKEVIKKLRREIENKTKESTLLRSTLKKKERELTKAKHEVLSGVFLFSLMLHVRMYNKKLC